MLPLQEPEARTKKKGINTLHQGIENRGCLVQYSEDWNGSEVNP